MLIIVECIKMYITISIGPSVVAFWRCVWNSSNFLLDNGFYQDPILSTNILALTIGVFVSALLGLSHNQIQKKAGEVRYHHENICFLDIR